ncbi:MAG: ATP-dependent Clp protease adapter ClpS [Desulfobacterota bacterium]|nr:ATP-dependent Clp protease adapter ClpS [Thermodesulfobacteriota bacterium]
MSSHIPEYQHGTEHSTDLAEPRQYRVLLHNDHYTTMDFVVQVLETVFNKSPAEATQIMLNVHKRGIGVCGVYPAEIAETKVALVHHLARQHNYPLKCSMEEA